MRIYGTIDTLTFDSKKYSAALKKRLEKEFRLAVAAFVRAAVPLIPVQTGMARGSFLNIGALVRELVPITPTRFNQRYYATASGASLPKTPAQGAALSTPKSQILKWDGNTFKFQFQSRVFHLTLNDFFGGGSPTAPWGAFEAGRQAFMNHLKGLKGVFPDVKSFFTKTTLTFGRGSLIKGPKVSLRKQAKIDG